VVTREIRPFWEESLFFVCAQYGRNLIGESP